MSVWDRVYAAEFHRQAVAYVGLRNARLPLSSRQLNEQPYQSVCGVIVLDDVVAGILATAAAKAADLAVKHMPQRTVVGAATSVGADASDGEPTEPTLVTSIVFAEAGERVSTDGDQQVRYKGFHDAYLCAARVVENAAQYTSKENADAIRESGLGDTLRRMALEVKEAAIKRLLRSTPP